MSSTAGGPNNADADVSADDVPPTDEVIPADEILDIPVPLADDDQDPPPSLRSQSISDLRIIFL